MRIWPFFVLTGFFFQSLVGQIVQEKNPVYVFVVGINEFESDYWNKETQNLKEDIVSVSENIQSYFLSQRYQKKVYLLNDKVETTKDAISQHFSKELANVEPNSVILFFLIGHGEYDADSEDFYLVTSNASKNSSKDEFYSIHGDLMGSVYSKLKSKKPLVITIVDACSSGQMGNLKKLTGFLDFMEQQEVFNYLLTSTSGSEKSFKAAFSESILELLKSGTSSQEDCDFQLTDHNVSNTMRPFVKKVFKRNSLDTTKLKHLSITPIRPLASDRFCLDSFRDIRRCHYIKNNRNFKIKCQVFSKNSEYVLLEKDLEPGQSVPFFSKLGVSYDVYFFWNDHTGSREKSHTIRSGLEEDPSEVVFFDNENISTYELAKANFEIAKYGQMINVSSKSIDKNLALASYYEIVNKLRNDTHLTNQRTHELNFTSYALTKNVGEDGKIYIIKNDSIEALDEFVVQKFKTNNFNDASTAILNAYKTYGDESYFGVLRDIEMSYVTANAIKRLDTIQQKNNLDEPLSSKYALVLADIPEIENLSSKKLSDIVSELNTINKQFVERVVKWIVEN